MACGNVIHFHSFIISFCVVGLCVYLLFVSNISNRLNIAQKYQYTAAVQVQFEKLRKNRCFHFNLFCAIDMDMNHV